MPTHHAHPRPAPAQHRSAVGRSLWANGTLPIAVALMFPVMLLLLAVARGEAIGFYDLYTHRVVMLCGISAIMAVSLQLINGFAGQFSLGHAGFMAIGAYFSAYPSLNFSQEMTNPLAVLMYFIALLLSTGLGGGLALGLMWLIRQTGRFHKSLPGWVAVAVVIVLMLDVTLAGENWTSLIGLVVSGLQRVYAAIAPHLSDEGVLIMLARPATQMQLPAWLGMPITLVTLMIGGGVCAGLTGLVVGLPTLRLRGDYLAIATLGFAEIIRIAITNNAALGGANGLSGMATPVNFAWLYGTLIVVIVLVWRIAYSAKGRAIQAVREDEIAARAIGIDTTHHKVMAFIAGSFFAGVGGVLYAHFEGYINPMDFSILRSIEFVVMVTLGGLGSISGAILAAFALTYLPELLRDPPSLNLLSSRFSWVFLAVIVLIIAAIAARQVIGGRWRRDVDKPLHQRGWFRIGVGLVVGLVLWELLIYAEAAEWTIGGRPFRVSDARMPLYALVLILMMLLRPKGLLGGMELWPTRRTRMQEPTGPAGQTKGVGT